MKPMKMSRLAQATLTFGLIFGTLHSANAATIVFTTGDITADTDISTTGTGVFAFNVDGAQTTINGVTFAALDAIPLNGTVGAPLTINAAANSNNINFGGGTAEPYNSLTAAYKTLISSAEYGNFSRTLTLNNLVQGQQYQLQLFGNDSRSAGATRNEIIGNVGGVGTAVIDFNSTEATGGVGDFALGTFTADSATQSFVLTQGVGSQISIAGVQLRAIPEPSAALLGALGILALLRRRR